MPRCSAITLDLERCKKNATCEGVCWIHVPKELNECGICFEESVKSYNHNIELDCKHIFCKECIFKWIVEKNKLSTCPMCRREISNWAFIQAHVWALDELLIYKAEICIYDLKKLSEVDYLFICTTIDLHKATYYSNDSFKKLQERMSKDSENAILFQKIIETSYSVFLLIKTNSIIGNPRIFHTILS